MPHVHLRTIQGVGPQLLVDGVDMTNAVAQDGFSVSQPHRFGPSFQVTLKLAPGSVDLDLPDCVIKALREPVEQTEFGGYQVNFEPCAECDAEKAGTRICNDADNHDRGCDCGNRVTP